MADEPRDAGLRSSVRRAVDGAFDATVGRVGHTVTEAAMDVTGATAQQVIEDLEPYLIQEAIPRIVEGLTPYLTDTVVPEVLEGITGHLVADTVPEIVDGVTAHLVAVTVPEVVAGVTPRLVADLLPALLEDLRPYLEAELVPRIVEGLVPHIQEQVAPELIDGLMPKIRDQVAPDLIEALMPRIEEQIAPQLVDALMPKIRDQVAPDLIEALMPRIEEQIAPQLIDALMPKIRDQVAPDLIDALMPRIRDEVAPQLVDALMPTITDEIAPQLVDSLMPKIRTEVVPLILDDIVDDPRVRDLIREQSQGLFLDALESVRENLADADDLVERIGRRLLRQSPRPQPESAVSLMLDAAGDEDTTPARLTRENLAEQRSAWRAMPVPPAPPGREFAHAGALTRLVAFGVDVTVVGWLVSQGLSALVNLLDSLFTPVPQWLVVILGGIAASFVPIYLGISWWLTGRSLGSWLVGTRVCTPDGRNPGFVRALVRSWAGVLGVVIWVLAGVFSLFDRKRRSWLDLLLHTEVRYVVPLDQQRRYIREELQSRQAQAAAGLTGPEDDADTAPRRHEATLGPGPRVRSTCIAGLGGSLPLNRDPRPWRLHAPPSRAPAGRHDHVPRRVPQDRDHGAAVGVRQQPPAADGGRRPLSRQPALAPPGGHGGHEAHLGVGGAGRPSHRAQVLGARGARGSRARGPGGDLQRGVRPGR